MGDAMEIKPRVSILVPSLNVVKYIRQFMDSIIRQSLPDIEILCVDAGSTDGTLEILEEFAKSDPRIQLIHSDRKSYGYQMNLGLDIARGEYIGIVETDDWIEPSMFETLWKTAVQTGADIIKSNHFRYAATPRTLNVEIENLFRIPYNQVFCPYQTVEVFTVMPTIWSAIYRRSMLEKNGIRFHETPGASYQDASFQFMVFSMAESMYCIRDCFYHYRTDNETSSMNSRGKIYCICDEMSYYYAFLERHPHKLELLTPVYYEEMHRHYASNYRRIAPEFKKEFLQVMYEHLRAAEQEGLLLEELFDPPLWKDL